jgi:DNA-binding MarR family transcriptional regulator
LGRAHRALREVWALEIADLGLSPPQAAILRAISEQPGSGVRELARQMCTDPMNAKRLADHLEQAGLLSSLADPSHRQRRGLALTDEGLVLAREVAARAAASDRRLSELLGAGGVEQLNDLLDRLEYVLAGSERAPGIGRRHGTLTENGHR